MGWSVEDRGYDNRLSCGYLSVIAKATKTRHAGAFQPDFVSGFMALVKYRPVLRGYIKMAPEVGLAVHSLVI